MATDDFFLSHKLEVVTKGYYSVSELAAMGLQGFPRSRKGWYDLVSREGWLFREVDGKGGAKGKLREYVVPEIVLSRIRNPEAQEFPGVHREKLGVKEPVATYRTFETTQNKNKDITNALNGAVLNLCLGACQDVHGKDFGDEPAAAQMAFAIDLYNVLGRLASGKEIGVTGKGLADFHKLERKGMEELLRLLLQMGWAMKYAPSSPNTPDRQLIF
ncbi:MAG TPA: hypothetical protein PKZ22_07865 [Accumulibacter sp.]|nr:hypothetical protein [Accumulibacter sp.]